MKHKKDLSLWLAGLLACGLLGFIQEYRAEKAAAALAKEALATGKSIRQLVVEKKLLPPERIERLFPEPRP